MTSRSVGYFVLAAALLSATPRIVTGYEDYPGYVSAVASNENAYRQSHYLIDHLADLETFFTVGHQDVWMTGPVIPGTDLWTVIASPADIPMDWNSLPFGFTSALVSTTDYGVVVYPLLIQENPTNHQVQYIAGGSVIHTMPTVYTNTSRYATNAYPNLYGGGYTPEQIAEIEAMYAPSRLVVAVDLSGTRTSTRFSTIRFSHPVNPTLTGRRRWRTPMATVSAIGMKSGGAPTQTIPAASPALSKHF